MPPKRTKRDNGRSNKLPNADSDDEESSIGKYKPDLVEAAKLQPTMLATHDHPLLIGPGAKIELRKAVGADAMKPNERTEPDSGRPITEFRQVLVLSVPSSVLMPNATSWGAYNYEHKSGGKVHAQEISFFMHAIYSSLTQENGRARIFVELMVRHPCGMPRCDEETRANMPAYPRERLINEVYDPTNVVGYRFWVFLGTSCFAAENLMRRAVFRVQLHHSLVPRDVVHAKMTYAIIPDAAEREETIRADALAHAQAMVAREELEKRRRKQRNGDAIEEEGADVAADGDDEEAESVEKRAERITATLAMACKTPVAQDVVARVRSGAMTKPTAQYLVVGTIQKYITDVLMSSHALAGTATNDASLWGAMAKLNAPWGECTWLPAVNELMLSAERRWSMRTSRAIFGKKTNTNVDNTDCACSAQCLDQSYFTADDTFMVPYRHLVWELDRSAIEPATLYTTLYPWVSCRFVDHVQHLKHLAHVERQRVDSALVAMVAESPVSPVDRAAFTAGHVQTMTAEERADEERMRRQVDEDNRKFIDECAQSVAGADDTLETARLALSFTNEVWFDDRTPGAYRSAEDRRTHTEIVVNGLVPVYTRHTELYEEGYAAIHSIVPKVDKARANQWHYQQTLVLARLHRADTSNALFGAICRSKDISEIHSNAYRQMAATGRLDNVYRRAWSPAPELTAPANSLISALTDVSLGLNLAHGQLLLVSTVRAINLQATDPGLKDNALHMMFVGAKATGKSMTMGYVMKATLDGLYAEKDHESACSKYSGQLNANRVDYHDEAPKVYTDQTERGHEAMSREIAQEKTQLTSQQVIHDRYRKDEGEKRAITERVIAARPTIKIMSANEVKMQAGVDGALLDRMDVILFAPAAHQPVRATERLNSMDSSDSRKVAWLRFCENSKEELAFNTLAVAFTRARILSVNTDVCKTMLNEAVIDLTRHVLRFGSDLRAAGRNKEFAEMMVYDTAFNVFFRSEASPLIRFVRPESFVPGQHPRDYVTTPVYMSDLATIMGPHLCAQIDHGLWMLTRLVTMSYPLEAYIAARALAALTCRFRRAQLVPAYTEAGARLVDTELDERLAERTEDGRVRPRFIEELLAQERVLDALVVRRQGGTHRMPAFAPFSKNIEGVSPTAITGKAGCDPNWLCYEGSLEQLATEMVPFIRENYYAIDPSQFRTVLRLMAETLTFMVPVFSKSPLPAEEMRVSSLKFERIAGKHIHYEPRNMIREVSMNKFSRCVLISTGALMVPPQYLLAMALTAYENAHTRPRTTVIPLEVYNRPDLMHSWSVCQRPARTLEVIDRCAPEKLLTAMVTASTGVSPPAPVSSAAANIANPDIEQAAFRRHMLSLHQMRPYHETVALYKMDTQLALDIAAKGLEIKADQTPTDEQFDALFEMYLTRSKARPGVVEEERAKARLRSPVLIHSNAAAAPPTDYPQRYVVNAAVQRYIIEESGVVRSVLPLPSPASAADTIAALEHELSVMSVAGTPATIAARKSRLAAEKADATMVNKYKAAKRLAERVASRMCSSAWHAELRPYALSYEWAYVIRPMSLWVYRRETPTPDGYDPRDARTWAITQRPLQAVSLPSDDYPMFSIRYLEMIGEWLAFHSETQAVAEVLATHPTLSILGAYDLLYEEGRWNRAKEHTAVVDAKTRVRAREDAPEPDYDAMELDAKARATLIAQVVSDNKLIMAYRAAKDRIRRIRAKRLLELVEATQDAVRGEMMEDTPAPPRPRSLADPAPPAPAGYAVLAGHAR